MKKVLLIRTTDGAEWIGGLYYKKNIVFSLLQNEFICKNYKIIVTVNKANIKYFTVFKDKVKLLEIDESTKMGKIKLYYHIVADHVKYVYPVRENKIRNFLKVISINWIPDFQHNYYPEYFTEDNIKNRTDSYAEAHDSKMPLVLSSKACEQDFYKFYGKKENVYVVPFVSYIENEIKKINVNLEEQVLEKYKLRNIKFACISNQFWQHKNHIVVLKAIKEISSKLGEFKFVFTGLPKDYRNPEYFNSIKKYMDDNNVKQHINVLGFIDRVDQLIIMKNSEFIIQPSLFEGWGTVVEDAKVLDKTILLSDIPVHREQMNEKCILFNPIDEKDLAKKILSEINIEHKGDIGHGIRDARKRAREYSKEFEKLLVDEEK